MGSECLINYLLGICMPLTGLCARRNSYEALQYFPAKKETLNVSEDACCQVLRKMIFLSISVEVVRKKGIMAKRGKKASLPIPSMSGVQISAFKFYLCA